MQAQSIKISKLKTNSGQIEGLPSNPRLIKDDKYKKLVKSIQDDPEMLDLRELIVYPKEKDFVVIGGNMRLRAMQELGYKEAPCKVLPEETPIEKLKAYTIKDNVGYGEHDWDSLANEWDLVQLTEWGLDIPDFAVKELEAEEDDYEIPDTIETDIVLGDLFEIGQHRLLCGDSTDSDAVARLMNGQLSDMVFTDPPYGENIDFSYLGWMTKQKHKDEVIKNDELTGESLSDFLEAVKSNIILFNKGAWYICSGWKQLPAFQTVFEHNMLIVWNKKQLGFGMGDYRNQTEFILYNKNKASFYGDNSQRNIWEVGRENDNKLHPTIKPVQLLTIPINNNSRERDLILDLFLGSGTTMVAAHQLNRKCYGMELDPKYCQVIIDRMLKLDPSLEIKRNGQPYKVKELEAA